MYVKTLACGIIPTLLYLHFKVKFLVHKVNLLYNYTCSVVVEHYFKNYLHYRDVFLYTIVIVGHTHYPPALLYMLPRNIFVLNKQF